MTLPNYVLTDVLGWSRTVVPSAERKGKVLKQVYWKGEQHYQLVMCDNKKKALVPVNKCRPAREAKR